MVIACGDLSMALLLFFICIGVLFGFSTAASDPGETEALLRFKKSVTDPQNNLKGWTGNDPCSPWSGITCGAPVNGTQHVQELSLSRSVLSGQLAPELGNLTYLTVLNLKFNQLEGSIPSSFGNLNRLQRLLVNDNRLSGSLAPELGSLSSLRRFQINNNGITGPIPPTFGNLTACKHLHFTNNSLNGSIPDDISRLNKLLHILLDSNQLVGPLPPSLNLIPNLTTIQIDNNSIATPIPPTWGQISTLYKLSLANCSLHGTIPDLSGLQSLTYLDLSNNSLIGSLPNLSSSLYTINLANNTLNGTIPDAYGQLQKIQALNIQNNQASGPIPASLGKGRTFSDRQTRVDINLENNQLGGLVGTALPDAAAGNSSLCAVWMAGNTEACSLLNAEIQSTVHCGVYSDNTLSNAHPPTTSGCSATTTCNQPYFQAPNMTSLSVSCRCAEPVTLIMQLISPGFIYVTPNLSLHLPDLLHDIFYFNDYSNIILISSFWYNNPPRLDTTLRIFPINGSVWTQDQILAMQQNLTDFNFREGLENDQDYLIMGPYEFYSLNLATTSSKGLSPGDVAGIALGCAATAAIVASISLLWCLHRHGCLLTPATRRKLQSRGLTKKLPKGMKIAGVRDFTFEEMEAATEKFKNEIGEGGYGKVYKGILKDGIVVAIKRAHEGCVQGFSAFYTEIDLLSRVHHRNLVELIGFCDDKGEQMLVYEFMPGGTLRDHLHPTEVLHFVTRMRIALATARGILYLHCDANPPIFHRDIKANNILLDHNFNAKVADFGLSRLAPMPELEGGIFKHHVSTLVKGTPGYLDPEYFLTQKLTDKSDVYSFGVVLMELITGLQPIHHGKNLAREVLSAHEAGRVAEIVDPYLPTNPPKAIESLVTLALDCCRDSQELRPNMTEVVRQLEDIARMIEPWSIPIRDLELAEDLPPSDPQSTHVSTETARTEMLRESIAGLGGR